jgi:hypothetical protein
VGRTASALLGTVIAIASLTLAPTHARAEDGDVAVEEPEATDATATESAESVESPEDASAEPTADDTPHPESAPTVVEGISPTPAGGLKLRVMVPDFDSTGDGVSQADIETVTGLAVFQVSKVKRFDVISGKDIAELLQAEADRQAVGCESDSDCLAELAGAMNAKLILSGQVSRLGPRIVIQLTLIDSETVEVKARQQIEARRTLDVPTLLKPALHRLTEEYGGIPGYTPAADEKPSPTKFLADLATHPDATMLLSSMGLGFAGACLPLLLVVPLAQSTLFCCWGGDLAGREYPYWWLPAVAGYGTYLGSAASAAVLAFVAEQYFGTNGLMRASLYFGAGVALFGGMLIVEPVVAWGTGILAARDLSIEHAMVETTAEEELDARAAPLLVPERFALRPTPPAYGY